MNTAKCIHSCSEHISYCQNIEFLTSKITQFLKRGFAKCLNPWNCWPFIICKIKDKIIQNLPLFSLGVAICLNFYPNMFMAILIHQKSISFLIISSIMFLSETCTSVISEYVSGVCNIHPTIICSNKCCKNLVSLSSQRRVKQMNWL